MQPVHCSRLYQAKILCQLQQKLIQPYETLINYLRRNKKLSIHLISLYFFYISQWVEK